MEAKEINTDYSSTTIAEIVAEDYRKAEVFKKFGLDFCCGGKKSVEKACSDKKIDAHALITALEEVDIQENDHNMDYNAMKLDELVDHIVTTHHDYVKESLPLIAEFSAKVARVHGNANPEVVEIFNEFTALEQELGQHMHKEEIVLFPFIKQLASSKNNNEPAPPPPFGTINNPITMMEQEHDIAGNTMTSINKLSNNYTPPEHACNTYRVLYAKLEEFENNLHQHVHLENNILFPKAIKLEEELLG